MGAGELGMLSPGLPGSWLEPPGCADPGDILDCGDWLLEPNPTPRSQ